MFSEGSTLSSPWKKSILLPESTSHTHTETNSLTYSEIHICHGIRELKFEKDTEDAFQNLVRCLSAALLGIMGMFRLTRLKSDTFRHDISQTFMRVLKNKCSTETERK